jgi:hypothetical protein
MKHPFAVPTRLPPNLKRAMAYWKGLRRGAAEMPFWDDARLSDLPELKAQLFLVDVFARPERFRLAMIGEALGAAGAAGKFIDETDLGSPFDFLRAQASATVESAAPTWFGHEAERGAGAPRPYARLLLPMWGDGRIGMLLGAVDFG